MTQPIVLYAGFDKGTDPVTGLTVTVNVYRITRSSGASSQIVTAGSATALGDGVYLYAIGSADLQIYDYLAAFKTTGDVDKKTVWAVYPPLANAYATELARLDATISSRNAVAPLDSTATQAAAAAALTAYDAATGADVAGISVPSAATVADAVWDEALAGHSTAGTAGQALSASGSASDPLLNTVPGSYASGTAGHALGRIANGQLTVVQPVLDDGFFRIVPGRDYLAADGLAFTFTNTSWPTLADGTTVEFIFGDETLDGERTGDQTVRLQVTAAQGETLAAARSGRQHYDMVATLPSGSVVGLAENAPVLVG